MNEPTVKRRRTASNPNGQEDADSVESTVCLKKQLSESLSKQQVTVSLGHGDQQEDCLLQQLLGQLKSSAFLSDCFQKCAVHIQAASTADSSSRFEQFASEFLHDLDPQTLLSESSSDNLFVWLEHRETSRIHSIEVNDAQTAYRLYESGHSTYCRAPPIAEQTLVEAMLRDTKMGCGHYDPTAGTSLGRGEVEIFLSKTPGSLTNWHFDFQENFTLQLSGVKQWTLYPGSVSHPLRACTPHYQAPETVESQLLAARLADPNFVFREPPVSGVDPIVVTLSPGDMFYFPAGMWHRVQVIEPGVSMNVSLMASNYASVTCQALHHWLLRQDDWRQCILHPERLQSLLERLPDLVNTFVQSCGSAAILPPAVTTPRTVGLGDPGSDESEVEDENSSEDPDPDELVVVARFQSPLNGFSRMSLKKLREVSENVRLVINPLASILKQSEEVENYYRTGDSVDPSNDSYQERLILNVNYAGNECHESVVRVVLQSDQGAYDDVVDVIHSTEPLRVDWLSKQARFLDCLVHFGFLLQRDKNDSKC